MITILVPNQKFKLKWSGNVISYYKSKGYEYTGLFDEFEVDISDLNPCSNIKVKCICDYCGKEKYLPYIQYLTQTKNEAEPYACRQCIHKKMIDLNNGVHPNSDKLKGKNKLSKDKVIELVESKNNNKLLNPDEYIDFKTKNLRIICGSCGKEFVSSLSSIVNAGGRCRKCGFEELSNVKKFSQEEVKGYVESINGNILLNPEEYINCNTKNLKIKCGKCGNVFKIDLAHYKTGTNTCSDCSRKMLGDTKRFTPEQVKEIIESQNNNTLLNLNDYTKNNIVNLKIKCGECGRVYTASLVNYQAGQIRCHNCSHSKTNGERRIEDFLNDNKINSVFQARFKDCVDKRPLPFDFYLPDYNKCIEFDGMQHFEPVFGKESFELTLKHDKIKNEYCESNGIDLLRIPYWEGHKIEQILTEYLRI